VTDELERIRKEVVVVYSRYYPSLWLEGFRETKKISNQDTGCLAEIRTEHILNGRQEHYRCVSPLGVMRDTKSYRETRIRWNHNLVNVFEKYPVRISAQAPLVLTELFKEDSWTLDTPLNCIWGMELKLHTILTSPTHSSSLHNHRRNR
jgi:hypothetical protein